MPRFNFVLHWARLSQSRLTQKHEFSTGVWSSLAIDFQFSEKYHTITIFYDALNKQSHVIGKYKEKKKNTTARQIIKLNKEQVFCFVINRCINILITFLSEALQKVIQYRYVWRWIGKPNSSCIVLIYLLRKCRYKPTIFLWPPLQSTGLVSKECFSWKREIK